MKVEKLNAYKITEILIARAWQQFHGIGAEPAIRCHVF